MIINEMPGFALDETTAQDGDILQGQTAYNGDGTKLTGTMPNHSDSGTIVVPYGQITPLPGGFYPNSTSIQAQRFNFSGDATPAEVLAGKTFYSDSDSKGTGSMTNNGAYTATTPYGGPITIPQGYHNGSGSIMGGLFDFSAATATASEIVSGYKAYGSDGSLITGTRDDGPILLASGNTGD